MASPRDAGVVACADRRRGGTGPLSRLTSLVRLDLAQTGLEDIGPLADLANLEWLDLRDNDIADLDPLAGLAAIRVLRVADNGVADLTPLAALDRMAALDFDRNVVADLAPLAGMPDLRSLDAAGNRITDLGALTGLKGLAEANLAENAIADIEPLAGSTAMRSLDLSGNALRDLSALSGMVDLWSLVLNENAIVDISPLEDLANLTTLALGGNRIADVAPLSGLGTLQWLDLTNNAVSDIEPLADRSVFGGADAVGAFVALTGNPLDEAAFDEHIPALESWGVAVAFEGPGRPVDIADPTLRSVVAEAVAGQVVHVDDASGWPMIRLTELRLMGRGVASLAGLDAAESLDSLFAAANRIADLAPLEGLAELSRLDLRDNRIADLAPLVANAGLSAGDWLALAGNPLSEKSLNEHIPALIARGVEVSVGRVVVLLAVGGKARRYDTSGYFEARLGAGATMQVSTGDETLAAEMAGSVLVLTPGTTGGATTVTVTATAADGTVESLGFVATVRGPARAPLVGEAMDPVRQGFVRVVNHGPQAGAVRVTAFDDAGNRRDGPEFELAPGEAVHFNSADLETGSPEKGLTVGTGRGTGDWRLELASTLFLDVLTYVRTSDGFLTAMHDVAEATGDGWAVPIFNPASNIEQVSSLRLSNLGPDDAEAVVTGVDDCGESPGGDVRVDIPADATVILSAAELEDGSSRVRGRLGDGCGKWRLGVASQGDLAVASLLSSPDGHLSNLSSGPIRSDADGVATVPLFPSAGPLQGFVRVANRSDTGAEIRIDAYDEIGRRYEPLTLAVGAGRTVHFNSDDLEMGNADKGLSGSTGRGSGDWRLEMHSALDIDVLAYVRTPGGFLAAMHDVVPHQGRRYEVATFNPGSNTNQVSTLRIVNPGDHPAHVSIAGVDDAGESPGEVVRLSVEPGAVRTMTAAELEQGAWGLDGRLGDGTGKWRLRIDCEQEVLVMNLLESPTGHLSNLSTAPSIPD
ncbi:MAG: leucine-rich repeat protein [Gammaproteobacteria bacterium]|nr:leucine-rich repeat protein [Gammaproteobacteria bacterium]